MENWCCLESMVPFRLQGPPGVSRPTTHRLQKAIVPRNGRSEGRVAHIGQRKFLTCLSHDSVYSGIMYMTNSRKQMMFNLKIQPTDIPGEQSVVWRKIRRGLHCMYGPFLVDCAGVGIRCGEDSGLHGMGQLKHHGQGETNRRCTATNVQSTCDTGWKNRGKSSA
jgi:hypothetical protein